VVAVVYEDVAHCHQLRKPEPPEIDEGDVITLRHILKKVVFNRVS
jgi:hypothetical protein